MARPTTCGAALAVLLCVHVAVLVCAAAAAPPPPYADGIFAVPPPAACAHPPTAKMPYSIHHAPRSAIRQITLGADGEICWNRAASGLDMRKLSRTAAVCALQDGGRWRRISVYIRFRPAHQPYPEPKLTRSMTPDLYQVLLAGIFQSAPLRQQPAGKATGLSRPLGLAIFVGLCCKSAL